MSLWTRTYNFLFRVKNTVRDNIEQRQELTSAVRALTEAMDRHLEARADAVEKMLAGCGVPGAHAAPTHIQTSGGIRMNLTPEELNKRKLPPHWVRQEQAESD
jgi:hypothetical protein